MPVKITKIIETIKCQIPIPETSHITMALFGQDLCPVPIAAN